MPPRVADRIPLRRRCRHKELTCALGYLFKLARGQNTSDLHRPALFKLSCFSKTHRAFRSRRCGHGAKSSRRGVDTPRIFVAHFGGRTIVREDCEFRRNPAGDSDLKPAEHRVHESGGEGSRRGRPTLSRTALLFSPARRRSLLRPGHPRQSPRTRRLADDQAGPEGCLYMSRESKQFCRWRQTGKRVRIPSDGPLAEALFHASGAAKLGSCLTDVTPRATPAVLFVFSPLCRHPKGCDSNHRGILTRWKHPDLHSELQTSIFRHWSCGLSEPRRVCWRLQLPNRMEP